MPPLRVLRYGLNAVLTCIAPQKCVVCERLDIGHPLHDPWLCHACEKQLPTLLPLGCELCAGRLGQSGRRCKACENHPLQSVDCFGPLIDDVKALVHACKFAGAHDVAATMARLMSRHPQINRAICEADLITAVPADA